MKYFICKNTYVFLVPIDKDIKEYITNFNKTKPSRLKKELRFELSDIFLDPAETYEKDDYRYELSERCYIGFNISNSDKFSKLIVNLLDTLTVE